MKRIDDESRVDQRLIFAGVAITAMVLAYFFAADRYFVSTRYMTQIFHLLLMRYDANTAWLTLGICLAAACWRSTVLPMNVVDCIGKHTSFVVATFVVILAVAAIFVYQNDAFAMDEYAEVFQAKVFAAGHLTADLPPSVIDWLVPRGFNGGFLVASASTGRTIEVFWPGFSMILAIFDAAGVPWLCNPCLTGLALLLVHRITREITRDERAAAWAVLFALASGAFVAYGISYYSMQARLAANLLFACLLLRPTPWRCFAAGIAGSFAMIVHSPFPHILFAAPWLIAMARTKTHQRFLLQLTLGYLPLLLIVGTGWLHLRAHIAAGSASAMDPITYNVSRVFSLPDRSMIDMRIAAIVKMWIWAVPCLFVFALLGRLRFGSDYRVRLLAQSAVLTFVGYIFVIFDQGHGWGYRYIQSAWAVIPVLAGCAMVGRDGSKGRLAAFAGAAALLNLVLVVPYQMSQIRSIIAGQLAQLPEPHRPGNNVYFIRGSSGFYSADLVQTDPFLRSSDLILFSRGADLDARLRRQNWPQAVLVARTDGVEEWNLGSTDLRQASGNSKGDLRFTLRYAETEPEHAPRR